MDIWLAFSRFNIHGYAVYGGRDGAFDLVRTLSAMEPEVPGLGLYVHLSFRGPSW
jgi:hypothetical protein